MTISQTLLRHFAASSFALLVLSVLSAPASASPTYVAGQWPYVTIPVTAWRVAEASKADAAFVSAVTERDAIGLPATADGRLVSWTKPSAEDKQVARVPGTEGDAAEDSTLYFATHIYNPVPNRSQAFAFSLLCNKRAEVYLDGAKLDGAYTASGVWTATVWGSVMRRGASRLVVAVPARGETKLRFDVREPGDLHFVANPPAGTDLRRPASTVRSLTLRNERVKAVIALPDSVKSPGRGYRYEQAGEILSLECDGHTFTFDAADDRSALDNLQPLAGSEEFAPPAAWEDSIPGESFIKIGVGLFERPFQTDDDSNCAYWPLKRFPWKTRSGPNWVEFTQVVDGPRKWAYLYTKRVVLVPNSTDLKFEHYFVNIGRQAISTDQCFHMDVRLDQARNGYAVKVPYKLKSAGSRPSSVSFHDGTASFQGGAVAYLPVTGYSDETSDNTALISAEGTPARLVVSGDFPLSTVAFHSAGTGLCYDQVVGIEVRPGEDAKWTRTITLATGAKP